jgi:hypothetical protein
MQKRWRVWDPLPEADLRGGDLVTGPQLQKMTKQDDWVLSIYEEQARGRGEDARRLDHAEASNEVALKTGDRGLIESKGGQ